MIKKDLSVDTNIKALKEGATKGDDAVVATTEAGSPAPGVIKNKILAKPNLSANSAKTPLDEGCKAVYCPKRRIINQIKYGDVITLREYDNMDNMTGAVVIEGFPSDSATGEIISEYIVEQLQLPQIGDITSRFFSALGIVSQGMPSHGCRIFGNKNIVVFTSEYRIRSSEIQQQIVHAIYDFAERHRCSTIIGVDSVIKEPVKKEDRNFKIRLGNDDVIETAKSEKAPEDEQLPKTPSELLVLLNSKKESNVKKVIWYVTNDEGISKKMETFGHKPVKELIVEGISGGIIAEIPYRDVKVVCLFAKVGVLRLGIATAVSLIHCIDMLLGAGSVLDTVKMAERVEEVEHKIKKVISDVGKEHETSGYSKMYL